MRRVRSWLKGFWCVLTACSVGASQRLESWPTVVWFHSRVGHKRMFLVYFGSAYFIIGQSLYATEVTPAFRHQLSLALAVLPLQVYGVGWMAAGIAMVLVGSSVLDRFGSFDRAGYLVGVAVPGGWATVYIAAWAHGDSTARGFVLYAVIGLAVYTVNALVDPWRILAQMKRGGL